MTGSLTAVNFFDYNNTTYYTDPSFTGYSAYLAGSIGAVGPFYDLSNTAYYVDPAGTSNLNTVCLAGICRTTWPAAGAETDTLATVVSRGNTTANFIQAAYFQDNDNTFYYANPSNVSYLYGLNLGGVTKYSWPSSYRQSTDIYVAAWNNTYSTAYCSAGYTATGGGGYHLFDSASIQTYEWPNADNSGWNCGMYNATGVNRWMTCHVRCSTL